MMTVMARPRVFISSTYYDLKFVRNDLEIFVRSMGYEPILNERGSISYGSNEKLEEYAYDEVAKADIVVAIIGGRFGTEAGAGSYSISNEEIRRALSSNVQVYLFIDRAVYVEYRTYLLNMDLEGVRYQSVDNVRVFEFIREIEQAPRNNTITAFDSAGEITEFLREQWAGAFQRYLADQRTAGERRTLEDISATADTLRRLVETVSGAEASPTRREAVRSIAFEDHPIFSAIKHVLDVPYRVFFTSRPELDSWLKAALGFRYRVKPANWDDDQFEEWLRGEVENGVPIRPYDLLKIASQVFDEKGRLRPFTDSDWSDDFVRLDRRLPSSDAAPDRQADEDAAA
jgi:Domain of unknown function (DUF4062)